MTINKGFILNLPGKATHYVVGNDRHALCGEEVPEYSTDDASKVDCKRCMKTKLFRNYFKHININS